MAPTRRLASRRAAAGSTATIVAAPAMRAPWTTDCPTPPQPMTATLDPGCTPAVFSAAPRPVVTPQPSSASWSSARSVCTGTIDASSTTIASANVPQPHTAVAVRPSGNSNRSAASTAGPSSQWLDRPLRHHQHDPQAGETDASTRSPTAARRTSGPTASTNPQPSWPGTIGSGRLDSPRITVRSVWQIPLAESRTSTSQRADRRRGQILDDERIADVVGDGDLHGATGGDEVSEHSLIIGTGCRSVRRR